MSGLTLAAAFAGIEKSSDLIPFALPDINEADIEAVRSVMTHGWLTTGPECARFESEFLNHLGTSHYGVAVNSATAALHLALEALGVGPGSEVILPTWTFTATAEVVRYMDALPVFVDVEPGTFLMNPSSVERALTDRTSAIIPVNFAGISPSYDWLRQLIHDRPISIILDAAHNLPNDSIGAELLQNIDAACFSFYATKPVTTGEGGFLATAHEGVAHRARVMRLHGIDRDIFDRYTADDNGTEYDVVAPGYKYNLTDMAAALGTHQLRRSSSMRQNRACIAARYDAALLTLPARPLDHDLLDPYHACHLYPLTLDPAVQQDVLDVRERLRAAGILTSMQFKPLHHFTYWRDFVPESCTFPMADSLAARTFSLPMYSTMTETQVERVVLALKEAIGA